MTRLDERERRVALWAAGFGAVSAVALYAPAFGEFTAAIVLALVGVAMAGLLALASRSGSRLFTCLAAGLLGIGPWGYAYIIGLPFILLAGWLMFRDANARRAARGGNVGERPVRQKRVKEKRVKEKKVVDQPAQPSRPGASKRYTPPAGRR
ncbi:MAG: hypothetical protein M3N28_07820 [Actinomycetota bacterium]|nr:hypothetical protein [Actinomycetota bacterium]